MVISGVGVVDLEVDVVEEGVAATIGETVVIDLTRKPSDSSIPINTMTTTHVVFILYSIQHLTHYVTLSTMDES